MDFYQRLPSFLYYTYNFISYLYIFFSRYGICFVSGLYCFALALILCFMFINDTYMVSLGVTYHEWQERRKGDRPLFLSRNIIRNILSNWRAFFNND